MDAVHEETIENLTIKIVQDDNVECPHEWGSLFGTMSIPRDRHGFGTPEKQAEQHFTDVQDLIDFLKEQGDNVISLPIFMYEHSGCTIKTGPFSCPWDSGQIGYIWISKEKAAKELRGRNQKPIKRWTPKQVKRVRDLLDGSIRTMDMWMTGDVYGWVVEDESGEHLESCWGYYGFDKADGSKQYILDEARSMARHIIAEAKKKAAFYAEEDRVISSMH